LFKSYKYSIIPTDEQKLKLSNYFGAARFVYNLALETKIHVWQSARKTINSFELCRQLKELKDSDAKWLKDCPAQMLQTSLHNLDNSFSNFFKGAGFPKFKSKKSKQSIQFPQGIKVDFNKKTIQIPKLKNIKCLFHREFKGQIKTVTISKTSTGKYFVSILIDSQKELPEKKPVKIDTSVGIDLGIKTFATLSDGVKLKNPNFLKKQLSRIRIEQRKMNRRFNKNAKIQSNSYLKQRLIVAKLNERVKNQREDYLHKVSKLIIDSYDTICLENLNISGMMGNHNLSLAIGEIGWYKFNTFLGYKAEWYGKNILYIGRFEPSSKTCSCCGTYFKDLTLKDREWACQSCGFTHDRDVNAANNIKTFGLRNQPATVNVKH